MYTFCTAKCLNFAYEKRFECKTVYAKSVLHMKFYLNKEMCDTYIALYLFECIDMSIALTSQYAYNFGNAFTQSGDSLLIVSPS